jgi:long-chain acyl-CoA synthetase
VSLSFLPLCHIFERMAGLYAMLAAGVTIAYAESFESVPRNVLEVHPTLVNAVPRFYEKVYARIQERGAGLHGLQGRLFRWGLERGKARARAHFEGRALPPKDAFLAALADRLVMRKIRAGLGGRLRLCISGGAPLPAEVMEFFIAIGVTVLEGYGLTETSPVICLNRPGQERPGSVGPPLPGVEIRIGEDGEILTRGPHVMRGYFHNEPATRAAIRDGWFHTGDVGRIEPDGRLVITDRLKDLLVTAGGKKVAPQPLEARLKGSRWVSEAVLLGDRQPYIVALIVPDFPALEAEANAHGWATDPPRRADRARRGPGPGPGRRGRAERRPGAVREDPQDRAPAPRVVRRPGRDHADPEGEAPRGHRDLRGDDRRALLRPARGPRERVGDAGPDHSSTIEPFARRRAQHTLGS